MEAPESSRGVEGGGVRGRLLKQVLPGPRVQTPGRFSGQHGKRQGRGGSEEAVPGPSVFPSGEPGVSGDFWGSQEGSRSLSGGGGKPSFPSPSAGALDHG